MAANPVDYSRHPWLRLVMVATIVFLYTPIITLVVFSFNDSRRTIVWRGFTTDWYVKAWNNPRLFEAFTNSLLIAGSAMVLATLIGTALAIGLWRYRFPARAMVEGAIALPIVVPEICMGIAMLVFFSRIGWPTDLPFPLNLAAIIFAHTAFCFPFVTMVVRARLARFEPSLEEAALDLGASTWQIYRDIIIPFLRPGMLAGAMLAFTLSLDDFVITFFTSGPQTVTFPVLVFSMVRFSVTPEVNAASTVLIVITALVAIGAMFVQGRSNRS